MKTTTSTMKKKINRAADKTKNAVDKVGRKMGDAAAKAGKTIKRGADRVARKLGR